MEVDSSHSSASLNPSNQVVERLKIAGVPARYYERRYAGLVDFVRDEPSRVQEIVSAILQADEGESEAHKEAKPPRRAVSSLSMEMLFREAMVWLQWLIFGGEPSVALKNLAKVNIGQRGVCGAVWGDGDIAYKCRTCEGDPTCAICVPCFENGCHKDHDYSMIYTGGGCCDCGDETAWKREGFCSKHRGTEQIQPLPEDLRNSVGPILDALFQSWRKKLLFLESSRKSSQAVESERGGNELSIVILEMLLMFCEHSESLLSFVSKQMISSVGLLPTLVHAEPCLKKETVKKLQKFLLKLIGEPTFKCEFAKVFVSYYPTVINEAIKERNDAVLAKHPSLSYFSVQIFTVPTLTPYLVKEMNLLGMLFGALYDILISFVGNDAKLEGSEWQKLYETTIRVLGDIRFVLNHIPVARYATHEARDISGTWLRILTTFQGMNPLKRETGIHIEEENETLECFFLLGHSISVINSLLVDGAFSVLSTSSEVSVTDSNSEVRDGDGLDGERQAKVGRLLQESPLCGLQGDHAMAVNIDASSNASLPLSVKWLISQCLGILAYSLENDKGIMGNAATSSNSELFRLRRALPTIQEWAFGKAGSEVDTDVHVPTDDDTKMYTESGSVGCCDMEESKIPVNFFGTSEIMYDCKKYGLGILGISSWPDIVYDVSSQDISIHLPLHRFLALLLKKSLVELYGAGPEPNVIANPSACYADFFAYVLGQSHPCGLSAFVMEHTLRARVFCAQVTAGMWRKNGDAALMYFEWYRTVRWSEDGLELDLFLLQCCAALAPADLFISRVLARFGLSCYLSLNLSRDNESEPVLVQEMLTLVIQILQERRFCGFTLAESLRRELICRLARGDATHSQLVKILPHDLLKFEQLQEILDSVAVYSSPSGFHQGKYSLRSSCWKELDLYHPRWNSKDLQAAEERYSCKFGVSALITQLPKWLQIYPPLKGLAKIATCKTMLQVIFAVLCYAIFAEKPAESRAPENVLISALHLLSLSLDICIQQKTSNSFEPCSAEGTVPLLVLASQELFVDHQIAGKHSLLSLLVSLMRTQRENKMLAFIEVGKCDLSLLVGRLLRKFAELDSACMKKLQDLAPEVVNDLSKYGGDNSSNESDLAAKTVKWKAKAKEKQAAMLAKVRAEQKKFMSAFGSDMNERSTSGQSHDFGVTNQEVCSLCHDSISMEPVSYLIFLQKSKLLSLVDRRPPTWEQIRGSEDEKGSIATSRTSDVFERDTFLNNPRGSPFRESGHPVADEGHELVSRQHGEANSVLDFLKARLMKSYLVQSKTNDEKENAEQTFQMLEKDMYIIIRRELFTDLRDESIMGVEDKKSDFLGKNSSTTRDFTGSHIFSGSMEASTFPVEPIAQTGYDGLWPADCDGIHLTSCGHAVHQGCLDRYLTSLRERSVRRYIFEGADILDPDQGEFLCPVCRRLANSFLPADGEDIHGAWEQLKDPSIDSSFQSGSLVPSIESLQLSKALCLLRSASNVVGNDGILKSFPPSREESFRADLESVTQTLSKLYFPMSPNNQEAPRVSQAIMMWDTLKYALMSMETAARSGQTTMIPIYDVDSMYECLKNPNGIILSFLLRVVQSVRTTHVPHIHQRFSGLQLFAESICSGISVGFSNIRNGKGSLKHVPREASSINIHFWNRASDPVLSRDPFSSLLWVLFCLPAPFISCKESLLALVHLFYVVSVIQAIITYSAHFLADVNKLGSQENLVADVSRMIREHGRIQQYFVSDHMESFFDVKKMVRQCTFPYLRKCALLWRLLSSSSPAMSHENDQILEGTPYTTDFMDIDQSELFEVQPLEMMFKIPSIDVVFKDKLVNQYALKWLQHLQRNCMANRLRGSLHVNPLVPFRLMSLPNIYQDLLQRYVKQRCPDCKKVNQGPALCLLCGRLCSAMWKQCCRESNCQKHATTCGAGVGVYLLIKRTTILLIRGGRQASWPSPYLDAYGEEDTGMSRGKLLYLNEERYAALNHMVASHGFEQNTRVLEQTTISHFII